MEKIGIIDLGSNSARLVIVNLFADGYFMVVDELKESVRLGQDMERDFAIQATLRASSPSRRRQFAAQKTNGAFWTKFRQPAG